MKNVRIALLGSGFVADFYMQGLANVAGQTVVVSSPKVPRPVAVRYGWADNPDVNLCNAAGLPAAPFRTDRWTTARTKK